MLPHVALRLSGILWGGEQSWSVGLRFRSSSGGDPGGIADIQTRLETWRDAIRDLHGGNIVPDDFRANLSTGGTITTIRCSAIGTDGKETAVALVDLGSPVVGTRAPKMPGQVAICISLDTGKPGASNRGRMYWPGIGAGIGITGRQGNIDTTATAQAAAGWIHDLNNAGASLISPSLAASVVSTRKNIASPITQVRVGDRLDIQRRRADKQNESYSISMVAD